MEQHKALKYGVNTRGQGNMHFRKHALPVDCGYAILVWVSDALGLGAIRSVDMR